MVNLSLKQVPLIWMSPIVSTSGNQLLIRATEVINLSANINTSDGNGDIVLEGQTSIKAIGENRTLNSGIG